MLHLLHALCRGIQFIAPLYVLELRCQKINLDHWLTAKVSRLSVSDGGVGRLVEIKPVTNSVSMLLACAAVDHAMLNQLGFLTSEAKTYLAGDKHP